jgi:3-methylcrotonyl-CoA carboxylase beta subunit
MPKLSSAIDPNSAAFKALHAHNSALVAELREKVAKAARGGSDASRDRHVARGKLLPRDRVERLLDPGSPFLEIGQLAANGMYGKDEASPAPG